MPDKAQAFGSLHQRCFVIANAWDAGSAKILAGLGFQALATLTAGQPATLPGDRSAGAPMHYTSGTTGKPKGVRRRLSGADPDAAAGAGGFLFNLFGIKPYDGNVHICGSPLYHTAVLRFASSSLHMGHNVVLMDKWTPEEMLRIFETEMKFWAEAARLYHAAAGHWNPVVSSTAQFNLAVLYREGRGVACDDEAAARWLRRAAGQGFMKAQHLLGLITRDGRGTPQDLVEALLPALRQFERELAQRRETSAQPDLDAKPNRSA